VLAASPGFIRFLSFQYW